MKKKGKYWQIRKQLYSGKKIWFKTPAGNWRARKNPNYKSPKPKLLIELKSTND